MQVTPALKRARQRELAGRNPWFPIDRLLRVCILLVLLPLAAGAGQDDNDGSLWVANQVAVPIDERFALHLMVQNRWIEDVDTYQRTVVRPWVSYAWSDRVDLALGYDAHDFQNPKDTVEHRGWQRIAYRHPLGDRFANLTLFTHFWLEERRFEHSETLAWRGRFQIGGLLPLPAEFRLRVRNEFLVDLHGTSRIRRAGLGENQFVTSLDYPLGRWLRIEGGYMLQYLDGKGGDIYNHTFVIGFAARTPALSDWF